MRGASPRAIQELAGHSSLGVTQRYTNLERLTVHVQQTESDLLVVALGEFSRSAAQYAEDAKETSKSIRRATWFVVIATVVYVLVASVALVHGLRRAPSTVIDAPPVVNVAPPALTAPPPTVEVYIEGKKATAKMR